MRYTVIGIAIVLLVALGVFDVLRASRLEASSGDAQRRLDSIPLTFGDWSGEIRTFDEKMIRATKAVAHSYRRYTRGGAKPALVDVLILAGPPGELGAHDPERCYGGTGHRTLGPRQRKIIADEGSPHSLWIERFEREMLPAGKLEVAWGWTADGPWKAADDARWEFSGRGLLYKIYVSRGLAGPDDPTDSIADFMTALAPLTRTALSGAKP